ncbi:Acetyltransferase (GNAT) family protein [Bacillus sp. 491mf]|uniref:GNAT family N-acetyltransferase n=1 Tax=Bacillus sp. 491mf TaxID=1761755 RepID=UPI0008E83829|nr:GNAT family N-acetyltransferase [Bacillus sp. 491mf]SFC71763.1 Acetyltransferase (GNAT) family protein [Bacillus sp. 491mf]
MKEAALYVEENNNYYISTNKDLLQIDTIHEFLCNDSYWAKGMPKELVVEAIKNSSLCYGVYESETDQQIGFARVVTDFVRFSWLADVFILPAYRGRGVSKRLIETIVKHPKIHGTRFMLVTKDAHALYEQYGFEKITEPEKFMMRKLNLEVIMENYGLEF